WQTVKLWEINQEFGLEGMPHAVFGSQSPSERAWYRDELFFTSPSMLKIPHPVPGIGNGTDIVSLYESYTWYHTQLILNDGNGKAVGTTPIDWAYTEAFAYNALPYDNQKLVPRVGTAGLLLEWLIKTLQSKEIFHSSPYFMIAAL